MSDLYQEIILDQLEHPQHQGELEGEGVVSRHELNASCGDEVTVYVRPTKVVSSNAPSKTSPIQIKWQGQGCAISMATMSLLAEKINAGNMTSHQVVQLTLEDLLDLLGLEEISPGRLKCVMLGLKAVQKVC